MHFDDSYFEDEVRDGFFVPSLMKRAWASQLEVLSDLDTVCKKLGITYWADAGTMLGAVRHGGIIPWDDDIDIAMKRKDYLKFINEGIKEMPSCYSLFNYTNDDDSWQYIFRIVNEKTILFDEERLGKFHGFPFCTGLDIVVFDALPNGLEEREEFKKNIMQINDVASAISPNGSNVKEYEKYIYEIEKRFNVHIDRRQNVKRQLYALNEKVFQTYSDTDATDYTEMTRWVNYKHFYHIPAYNLEETVRIPFENTEVPVPCAYYDVLENHFGKNYMKFVRAWDTHDYPFYEKQEAVLFERTGASLKKFKPDVSEIICEKNKETSLFFKKLTEYCDMLFEAVTYLDKLYKENSFDEKVSAFIANMQELAIKVGTFIENTIKEETKSVKILEEFCEECYKICLVAETSEEKPDFNTLISLVNSFKEAVGREFKERKETVFLSYKAQNWHMLSELYKKHKADDSDNVYVIPLPYYYVGDFSQKTGRAVDNTAYPSDVVLTNPDEYDISLRHPDTIYIELPFDNYSFGSLPDERFMISEIRKHTDRLVCVPYFEPADVSFEDKRMLKSVSWILWSPGVVFADEILISDERIKEVYINILSNDAKNYVTGKDLSSSLNRLLSKGLHSVWENKIRVCKEIANGKELSIKSGYPDLLKPLVKTEDGSIKKVLLYRVSPGLISKDKDEFINKFNANIEVFKGSKESVTVLLSFSCKEKYMPKEFMDLVSGYQKEGILHVLADGEYEDDDLLSFCDAFYGDIDHLALLFANKGKPVMIQSLDT